MVESQVRPSDITDRRIIRAMLEVPREAFAPEAVRSMAYMDGSLPVSERGRGARHLLAPRIFAKLVQLAGVEPDCVVLDVGCATGYSTAVLARLARKVVALEVDEDLAGRAERALRGLGIANAAVVRGALSDGWPALAPFDAILLNGSVPAVSPPLLEQLKDGGRLVAVIADGRLGSAQVFQRTGRTTDARAAFDAGAEPLPGFERATGFVF
jgi:protein-L-isoaspartate(D-aspartate) O-methyltransferase